MNRFRNKKHLIRFFNIFALVASWCVASPGFGQPTNADSTNTANSGTSTTAHPSPLLSAGKSVDWWFVFKFNAATFPGDVTKEPSAGIFGGKPTNYNLGFSLNYAFASSADGTLKMGTGCVGTSTDDPVGATFDEIYHGNYFYVVWNDQFDKATTKDAPWGHSKGVIAWDASGAGVVMQVSTPAWPASGSAQNRRTNDGNTLGCVVGDDDVLVSQHFFALKLNPTDVASVLQGLVNASVFTEPTNPEVYNIGGPAQIQAFAKLLGKESASTNVLMQKLSSGVIFISKPSARHVPPWQMVSAELGGVPIRAATWWANPDEIASTAATSPIGCWNGAVQGRPGAVQIATTGTWQGQSIGLKGGANKNGNHAKIGVSTDGQNTFSIFGDMNQQGMISGDDKSCEKAQNGRGGTFYVLTNSALYQSVSDLLTGDSDQ